MAEEELGVEAFITSIRLCLMFPDLDTEFFKLLAHDFEHLALVCGQLTAGK
jgi:hypothetical protein